MSKSGITILGFLSIVLVVVAISGCTSTQTYSSNGISFQYPDGWSQYTPDSQDPEEIVAFNNTKGYSLFNVFVTDAGGQGQNYWYNIHKTAIPNGSIIFSDKTVQIAGVTGNRIDTVNMGYNSQQADIIFVKNDKTYSLLFTTGKLEEINSDINTIVNSFQTT